MGKEFIIVIEVDESSQLHYITRQGKRIYYYRQANKNVGQTWQEAEQRRNNEKFGIKIISSKDIIHDQSNIGTGIYNKIGNYPSGPYYYKYMSLETALLCLSNSSIRFAEPTTWADKYEERFYKATINGLSSSADNPPLLGCCFTYRQDNEAAWKLYSYDHKGLNSRCVEFKLSRPLLRAQLLLSLLKLNSTGDDFSLFEGSVEYWDQRDIDELHKKTIKREYGDIPNEKYQAFFNNFSIEKYINLLLLKRTAFLHEQEVRFFIIPHDFSIYNKTEISPIDLFINWADIILEVRIDANCTSFEQKLLEDQLKTIHCNAKMEPYDVYKTSNKVPLQI